MLISCVSSLKNKNTKIDKVAFAKSYGPRFDGAEGEASGPRGGTRLYPPKEVKTMPSIRVALCQMNPVLGDLAGNVAKMKDMVIRAEQKGAQLIVFPELAISGYPPQDTLKYEGLNRNMEEAEQDFVRFLKSLSAEIIVVWGNVRRGRGLRNSAKIFLSGNVVEYQDKRQLPNYGVFDEGRYFRKGDDEPSKLFSSENFKFGVTICEDIWYQQNYLPDFALNGAQVVVNINASPFHEGKPAYREAMIKSRAVDNQVFILYCNMVGGQDGIVFDGGSMVVGPSGNLIARAELFKEDILFADLSLSEVARARLNETRLNNLPIPEISLVPFNFYLRNENEAVGPAVSRVEFMPRDTAQIYEALVLVTRDYVRKNGFKKVVIGASGGIDSALCATIACDALGPENVHLILLPSKYSSWGSVADATKLAKNLGASRETIPIQRAVDALKRALKVSSVGGVENTVTEENLQARVRANILMAYSNSHPDTLLLSTGNKSEVSVGYFTLYGDSAGAFNPLLDVYKTVVYELAKYRNRLVFKGFIPEAIIEKPPSAELRKEQKDTDSLPPYDKLDVLLKLHIGGCMTSEEIIASGFCREYDVSEEEVRRVIKMVQRSEHKRQQAVLGSRISPIAFGIGRRMPNVNRFKL